MIIILLLMYSFTIWLGLYLIGRDGRSARLWLTGAGLLAYALALACDMLAGAAVAASALTLARWSQALLLLPVLSWSAALLTLLPEELPERTSTTARVWAFGMLPVALVLLASLRQASAATMPTLLFGGVALLPMLALVGLSWRAVRQQRTQRGIGLVVVGTIFFGLSIAFVLAPLDWLPRPWLHLLVGTDLLLLGVAIARFDAFDLGEMLLPDMLRSLAAAAVTALLFGGQVALLIVGTAQPLLPVLALLLAVLASAVAVAVFAGSLEALLDRVVLGRLPRVRAARAALRATASALPRRDPALDLAKIDEAEFARLTRRALSHFGDLSRLAASPLINLPLVERRLAARTAAADPLERAAELKLVLADSIARLKPRSDELFGTSDEWRFYNALHFPYIVGLKPYSTRLATRPADPAAREALAWFQRDVPERTLRNWQNAAARLVASDLRAREF